ncbi:MAG: hypothetical protein J3K34DRAFT_414707 [Monoraphidium minutum]|nr:MAG: hypothetical protein J3K34DRAFT_414707 [Monoraphidium minutum]
MELRLRLFAAVAAAGVAAAVVPLEAVPVAPEPAPAPSQDCRRPKMPSRSTSPEAAALVSVMASVIMRITAVELEGVSWNMVSRPDTSKGEFLRPRREETALSSVEAGETPVLPVRAEKREARTSARSVVSASPGASADTRLARPARGLVLFAAVLVDRAPRSLGSGLVELSALDSRLAPFTRLTTALSGVEGAAAAAAAPAGLPTREPRKASAEVMLAAGSWGTASDAILVPASEATLCSGWFASMPLMADTSSPMDVKLSLDSEGSDRPGGAAAAAVGMVVLQSQTVHSLATNLPYWDRVPSMSMALSEGVTSRQGMPTRATPAGFAMVALPERSTTVPRQLPPSRSLVQLGTVSQQPRPWQLGLAPMTDAGLRP